MLSHLRSAANRCQRSVSLSTSAGSPWLHSTMTTTTTTATTRRATTGNISRSSSTCPGRGMLSSSSSSLSLSLRNMSLMRVSSGVGGGGTEDSLFRTKFSSPFGSQQGSMFSTRTCPLFARAAPASGSSAATTAGSAAASAESSSISTGSSSAMEKPVWKRGRLTKQKKKHIARYEKRERLAALGMAPPKPNRFFPVRQVPVVNAADRELLKQEIAKQDAIVSATLKEKASQQQPIYRYHMNALRTLPNSNSSSSFQLRMSDKVRKLFELKNGNQQEVVAAQKKLGMELFQRRPGDTGSSAVQVVALSTRIQQLKMHCHTHRKDKSTKRGLDALYTRRRKLLDYMERREIEDYRRVVKTLGLFR